jgi:hypothetical protein
MEISEGIRDLIMVADNQTVRSYSDEVDHDTGAAVAALLTAVSMVGDIFENLGKPNADDNTEVAVAEQAITEAKVELVSAAAKWFGKERAETRAKKEIKGAEQALKQLQAAIQLRINTRLQHAKIDDVLTQLEVIARRVYTGLDEQRGQVLEKLQLVKGQLDSALGDQKTATEVFQKLDGELATTTNELGDAEARLGELTSGTKEHTEQNAVVVRLRGAVQDCQGRRANALVRLQNLESEIAQCQLHVDGHTKMSHNMRMLMSIVKDKTDARIGIYQSWLTLRKAHATTDAASGTIRVGDEVDQREAVDVAAMVQAAGRTALRILEDHPRQMQQFGEVSAFAAQAEASYRERMGKLLDEYRRLYGVDPMASSVSTYFTEELSKQEAQAS